MTAPMVIEGAMNGPAFLAYIERCLGPTLRRGDIVAMDNCRLHKVAGVEEAIEARGGRVEYLPAYSPDLNPIQLSFSKFQRLSAEVFRADPSCATPARRCFHNDTFSCRMP